MSPFARACRVALLSLVIVLGHAASTLAETVRVVVDRSTIWSASNGVAITLAVVHAGTVLDVRAHEGEWVVVAVPGAPNRVGYILAFQVEPSEPLRVAPAEPASAGRERPRLEPPRADNGATLSSTTSRAAELTIPRVSKPPAFEDLEPGRRPEGTMVSDFQQNEPGDGTPATLATVAFVSYDANNLYIVFDCADEPSEVRARMSKREDAGDDDQVSVYLDTFQDRRRAYVFSANPLGIQNDGIRTEGQGTDNAFDAVWRSDARLSSRGFAVIFTIPFRSLRFSNDAVQTWGFALGRYSPRTSESAYWPYITSRISGFVNQLAILRGIEKVSPSRNFQAIPYGVFTNARYLDAADPSYVRTNDERIGLDAKLVVRNAFTLDVTVNPDFSQVESDDPQVTVNQRFEVFFPEKRPFFSENADLFATSENLIFTRRIVDPQFGARLTGKVGRWALGTLIIDDRAQGANYPEGDRLSERRAVASVGRIQRDIGKESSFGLLVSDRRFASSGNRIISADTRLRLSPNWTFQAQAIRSEDVALDARESSGSALNAHLGESGRHFSYKSDYLQRSPDFQAALGFIKRTDVRETDHYAGYYWRPGSGALLAFGPSFSIGGTWDYRWQVQDWYVTPRFEFYFRRQYGMTFRHSESSERFAGTTFRQSNHGVSAYSSRSQRVSVNGDFGWGDRPNYSPPPGVVPFLGRSTSLSAGITIRPARRLRIDDTYYFSRLSVPNGLRSGNPAVSSVFRDHLNRATLNFQFTRALSVRAIADYGSLLPNTALIQQSLSKQLTGDFLLVYQVNPFTALYAGYTERYANQMIASEPGGGQIVRRTQSASTFDSRQVFIKLSYRLGL